jgi:hypothetical protein
VGPGRGREAAGLATARDADRLDPAAQAGRRLNPVRREHVDDEAVALIALCVAIQVGALQLEPLLAQRAIDPPERPLGPGLAEDVDIMGHTDFGRPVLQGVDLHHQAADGSA